MNESLVLTTEEKPTKLIVCNNLPGVPELITQIRADRIGGQPLRDRLYILAKIMGEYWQECNPVRNNGAIIGIPRSGISMSEGLRDLLPNYSYYFGFGSNGLEKGQRPESILIADAVINTGETIIEVMRSLQIDGRQNNFFVFSVVVTEQGINKLLSAYPDLIIYAGEMEKTVSIFDHYRRRLVTTIPNIGNIGALVSRD